jgi:hypothetical protein
LVVKDAVGFFVGSSSGGFLGVAEFVEFDIFSYTDITSNAEVSNSLCVNSLFSVGLIACAAVGKAFSLL